MGTDEACPFTGFVWSLEFFAAIDATSYSASGGNAARLTCGKILPHPLNKHRLLPIRPD